MTTNLHVLAPGVSIACLKVDVNAATWQPPVPQKLSIVPHGDEAKAERSTQNVVAEVLPFFGQRSPNCTQPSFRESWPGTLLSPEIHLMLFRVFLVILMSSLVPVLMHALSGDNRTLVMRTGFFVDTPVVQHGEAAGSQAPPAEYSTAQQCSPLASAADV